MLNINTPAGFHFADTPPKAQTYITVAKLRIVCHKSFAKIEE
jgi:hypothetical protein